MEKIFIINGSPRGKNSCSKYLTERVIELLNSEKKEISVIFISEYLRAGNYLSVFENIINSDSIVFAFPLYQDSLPAIMLDFLIKFEYYITEYKGNTKTKNLPMIYAIINCGFFESKNNALALQIMHHFCHRTSLKWRFGLGIGAGEFMKKQDNTLYLWMKQPVLKALSVLANELRNPSLQPLADIFVNPRMPVFIYNFVANSEWKKHISENPIK